MDSFFDITSMTLFIATASIFFLRFKYEDPRLAPFTAIALACAASNWMGENNFQLFALCLLISASFLLLHITSQPYVEDQPDFIDE